MKYLFSILLMLTLLSCSKDVHDYTMGELYSDYYIQKQAEKKLTIDEKNLIDAAEKQYISRGKENELKKKSLGELIKEFSASDALVNINNVTDIKILDKFITTKDSTNKLKWKIQILNRSNKDIIHVQGWLVIHDKKTKEIMRNDTIDCQMLIKSKSSLVFITNPQDYDSENEGNRVINNLTIGALSNLFEWVPVSVMFSDSTELMRINL